MKCLNGFSGSQKYFNIKWKGLGLILFCFGLSSLNAWASRSEFEILKEKYQALHLQAAQLEQFPSWNERRWSDLRCLYITHHGLKYSTLITTLNKFIPGSGPLLPDRWERRILVSNDWFASEDDLIRIFFNSMWTFEKDQSLQAGMQLRSDFRNSPYEISLRTDQEYIYFFLKYAESPESYGYCWNL